jgi:hypothetical protein
VIDRFVTVDGLLSSGAVLVAALFWDHEWSRAAETATVMALLRFGYWLYRWSTGDSSTTPVAELMELERQREQARAAGWASWK